jgi:hypothetical protein
VAGRRSRLQPTVDMVVCHRQFLGRSRLPCTGSAPISGQKIFFRCFNNFANFLKEIAGVVSPQWDVTCKFRFFLLYRPSINEMSTLLSPAFYSTFEDSEADMSTRSLEDVPEEGPPTPSGSPSGFRPTNSRKGPPSIRTLGQGRSSSDTSSLRRISSTSSSTAGPPTAVALTTKEKSSRTSGTLHKVRSSPRLPHDPEVEAAPSTVLYWSKAPVFGVIPTRTMRAHTVTLVDTTAWLFGGCDDKECSRDIFCFDTGTLFNFFHL